MFYPYMIYCCLAWGSATEVHLRQLQLIQKRIVRIIDRQSYLAHSGPIFKNLSILKIKDIYRYLVGIYAFKKVNQSNLDFSEHGYFTRNSGHAVVPFKRLCLSQRSVDVVVPSFWNSLSEEIKNNEIETFKSRLREYLMSLY